MKVSNLFLALCRNKIHNPNSGNNNQKIFKELLSSVIQGISVEGKIKTNINVNLRDNFSSRLFLGPEMVCYILNTPTSVVLLTLEAQYWSKKTPAMPCQYTFKYVYKIYMNTQFFYFKE